MANGWRRDRLPDIVRSMASRPRHEALRGLAGAGWGATPLLVVSAGLACFGVYCLLDARYRRA